MRVLVLLIGGGALWSGAAWAHGMVIGVLFEGDTAIIEVSYSGDGTTVPGARIEIRDPKGAVLGEGKTDEWGRFVLPDLPGPVEVIAETVDHRPGSR